MVEERGAGDWLCKKLDGAVNMFVAGFGNVDTVTLIVFSEWP